MNRMSAAEYLATQSQPEKKPGRNKYGAQKETVDGREFDSKAEARRYRELRQLERAGDITELECQVPIPLEGRDGPLVSPKGRKLKYVADFRYRERDGARITEDAKGYETKDYKLKRAILAAQGVEIREIRYT